MSELKQQLKQLVSKLTAPHIVSATVAILAALAAFGVTLSAIEQGAIVGFVGAAALVLLKYPTPESILGLVVAGIALAVAFGLPVSSAQKESILALTGAIAAIVLGRGAQTAVAARKAKAGGPVEKNVAHVATITVPPASKPAQPLQPTP